MKASIKALVTAMVVLAGVEWGATAAELWTTDFPAAQAQARKENRLILMNFTGSDWCGWCKKLKSDVFATKEFEQFARGNLVLVEVDFPNQVPQTQALKAANEALQKKFKVDGYPTIVVLDKDGKEVWRQVGYLAGGPSVWIGKLKGLK